jgi:hypothetical protein
VGIFRVQLALIFAELTQRHHEARIINTITATMLIRLSVMAFSHTPSPAQIADRPDTNFALLPLATKASVAAEIIDNTNTAASISSTFGT